ncbi:Rgg/GadR/MutR family transcriptional regulator [Alkalibacterium iburiense]|uniref:Rgg/GadR/MutR family transcriptional regulator n=1 Tax=Alkalibacterium iburiense TaxID=290589 RepID=A0ABN0XQY1_9LACT
MDFGQTFKRLRKSKGMTLKEAAGDGLSIAQLSRFENGLSMVTVDLLYDMLININTTPQEYYFLMGKDTEEKLKAFFQRVIKLDNDEEYDEELSGLKDMIRKTNARPYSWEQYFYYFVESQIQVRKGKNPESNRLVLDYLLQVDDWGEMELRLYAFFGFMFPVETTHFLMKTAIKKSQLYQAIPQSMKLLQTILTNNFSTFIYHDRLDFAEEALELLEKECIKNNEFVETHLNLLFNKGILAFKKNDPEKGKAYCEQVLSLCDILKQVDRKKIFANRYKAWKKEYTNPNYKELLIEPGLVGLKLT